MNTSRVLALVLVLAASAGCTSYKDDIATICDAPDKIGDISKLTPSEKWARMGKYMEENVKSDKGKELLWALSASGRGARNKMIRGEANKAGINPCHITDIP